MRNGLGGLQPYQEQRSVEKAALKEGILKPPPLVKPPHNKRVTIMGRKGEHLPAPPSYEHLPATPSKR